MDAWPQFKPAAERPSTCVMGDLAEVTTAERSSGVTCDTGLTTNAHSRDVILTVTVMPVVLVESAMVTTTRQRPTQIRLPTYETQKGTLVRAEKFDHQNVTHFIFFCEVLRPGFLPSVDSFA